MFEFLADVYALSGRIVVENPLEKDHNIISAGIFKMLEGIRYVGLVAMPGQAGILGVIGNKSQRLL